MITRPIAVARGLLTLVLVWGLGSAATFGIFRAVGAHTTIQDVSGQAHRVQIIWWGSHAFFACVGALLGVVLGGSALTRGLVTDPPRALATVAVPVLVLGLLILATLCGTDLMSTTLGVASVIGLFIGMAGGGFYVLESGAPDSVVDFYDRPRRKHGQSWGSR